MVSPNDKHGKTRAVGTIIQVNEDDIKGKRPEVYPAQTSAQPRISKTENARGLDNSSVRMCICQTP